MRNQSTERNETIEAVYHVDPLCGWCFAIADDLAEARALLGDRVTWTIAMGGLVTGDRVRPVRHDAQYLRDGLEQVARVSGRRASSAYFEQIVDVGTWVSDSEPVCRAVLVAIELGGIDAGFTASHFLSDGLYIDGLEPDTSDAIEALATALDLDAPHMIDRWSSKVAQQDLAEHWRRTRSTGLTTYPTIATTANDRMVELVTGFADAQSIVEALSDSKVTLES